MAVAGVQESPAAALTLTGTKHFLGTNNSQEHGDFAMRTDTFALTALGLLVATMASAQPSFDCSKASSDAEMLICSDPDLGEMDQRLSARYAAAMAAAEALDAGQEAAVQELRATQRGWIKGRDECWKADDLRACVAGAYQTREAELVASWMLEAPDAVVSFTCDDNPANEVTVFFFNGASPAIRLEYGDGIRAGWLVPAASGSKYATPFGGMFWQKGDEALFVWTEGQELSCRMSGQ
jgi:uncharacterized protein